MLPLLEVSALVVIIVLVFMQIMKPGLDGNLVMVPAFVPILDRPVVFVLPLAPVGRILRMVPAVPPGSSAG